MPVPAPLAPPDLSRLASEMKRLRAERGLTYEQLAERSGLSRRGVIALERGERTGEVRTWYLVSAAFGVPFSEFVAVLDA